jgi:hypothetical protein
MRALLKAGIASALPLSVWAGADASAQPAPPAGRFELSGGVVVPTSLRLDGKSVHAGAGPIVFAHTAMPLVGGPWSVGGQLGVGAISVGERSEQVNLAQLTATLAWNRPRVAGGSLVLGVGVGYRRLFADVRGYDAMNGIATDVKAAWLRPLSRGFTAKLELGALAQPWGSNGTHTVALTPAPYLTIGVAL